MHKAFESNKANYESIEAVRVYNHEKDKWTEQQVYTRYFSSPGRLLDLGCGTGRTSIELARRGHTVVAVDYSEAMIDEARRLPFVRTNKSFLRRSRLRVFAFLVTTA